MKRSVCLGLALSLCASSALACGGGGFYAAPAALAAPVLVVDPYAAYPPTVFVAPVVDTTIVVQRPGPFFAPRSVRVFSFRRTRNHNHR